MTNKEKYKDILSDYVHAYVGYCVNKDGEVRECGKTKCYDCIFHSKGHSCSTRRLEWLREEYKEPEVDWSKVEPGTRILVNCSGKIMNRYFVEYNEVTEEITHTMFVSDGWGAEPIMHKSNKVYVSLWKEGE